MSSHYVENIQMLCARGQSWVTSQSQTTAAAAAVAQTSMDIEILDDRLSVGCSSRARAIGAISARLHLETAQFRLHQLVGQTSLRHLREIEIERERERERKRLYVALLVHLIISLKLVLDSLGSVCP